MKYLVTVDDQEFELDISDDGTKVKQGETEYAIDLASVSPSGPYSILIDGRSFEGYVEFIQGRYRIDVGGQAFELTVEEAARARLQGMVAGARGHEGPTAVNAPMPGLVVNVLAEVGQEVTRGQTIVVLSAMKMENELRAPRDGKVREILVGNGDTVTQGQALVTLE